MSRFMDTKFALLEEYVPGEQPTDMKYIKLNTNESPFPPSPLVLKAIDKKEIDKLELYPDPVCSALTKRLAETYGVRTENIFIGNGSDEVLNFAFMSFCENGAAFADITYGFYEVYADLYGIKADIKPLKEDFSIPVDDFKGINKAIFIANPNAPTGMTISLSDIEEILKTNPDNVVLIDEAYVDFGAESAVNLVHKYDNLLVVQTYSKSRSLAGGRLGYAIGNEEIIKDLNKIKFSTNPYNINRLTLITGEASLNDAKYYKDKCDIIIANREYTVKELKRLGFEVLDSKANFVFAKCNKIDGGKLYLKLKENGILIRHFTKERIKDYNRITIGTMEQMKALIEKIELILDMEAKSK
ncbi:MAG: histidinol-phosphate transaminase [Candidatus Metalachnospira sp.]|nr:histidinol-phosphate transaminase [Candidatus Metalachnospira sp.]